MYLIVDRGPITDSSLLLDLDHLVAFVIGLDAHQLEHVLHGGGVWRALGRRHAGEDLGQVT